MEIKSYFLFLSGKLGNCLAIFIACIFLLIGSTNSEAAATNYDGFYPGTLYNDYYLESDLMYEGNDVGDFISAVYVDGSGYYTYVLTVTPNFFSSFEFNLGRLDSGPDVSNGYNGIYGYSFSEAINAFGTWPDMINPVGSGDDIFYVSIDNDNTIDWNVTDTYLGNYYWLQGETVTFFFQHSSEPVMGFYNLASGPTNPTADGFVPAPVPIPCSFILLGSCLLGLLKFRKKSF
ncbi:MAG: hypothetical protein PVG39_25145 [Desulfobacteraceae bacterium]|jgi:hypothetical protein